MIPLLLAACAPATIEGRVTQIGPDTITLAEVGTVPIASVLAAQVRLGDRVQAERSTDGEIARLTFVERAEPGEGPAIGTLLLPLQIPGIDGPFPLGAGQGTPTVLAFLYTTCGIPTACPMLTAKLGALQAEIRGIGRIVTITLDPDGDTLDVLSTWAGAHAVDRETWKVGRLEFAELTPLLGSLDVPRVAGGGPIVHGQRIAILDGSGRLAWVSEGGSWDVAEVAGRLRGIGEAP